MIIHKFNPKIGFALVTPEDGDDLWCLRRIIEKEDLIASETSRAVKQTGEYTRPSKGERIPVKLTLQVYTVELDNSLDRLRVRGNIVDAPEDFPVKHSNHSLNVTPGKRIGIRKRSWKEIQINSLNGSGKTDGSFIVVAADSREAGISIIRGTHVENFPTVDSGASGKRYDGGSLNHAKYFDRIRDVLAHYLDIETKVLVSGPGNIKNLFVNYLKGELNEVAPSIMLIEGVDLAGEDGVRQTLRSGDLKEVMDSSKLARASSILDEIMKRISKNDLRVALGFNEVNCAVLQRSVESVLASDRIFQSKMDEEKVVQLLNRVEEHRGKVFLLDGSTDLGNQVSTLGGLLAVLRFHTTS